MNVQCAKVESKCAPLASEFARGFVTRQFGEAAMSAIYATLPRFVRGKHKGEFKGFVCWTKCHEGGWLNQTGGYGDKLCGRVVYPGTTDVRITAEFMRPMFTHDSEALFAGDRRGNESDEGYAARCAVCIAAIFQTPDLAELRAAQDAIERKRQGDALADVQGTDARSAGRWRYALRSPGMRFRCNGSAAMSQVKAPVVHAALPKLRVARRSNQMGVKSLWLDAGSDGCFEAARNSSGCVEPRVVKFAEAACAAVNAHADLIEKLGALVNECQMHGMSRNAYVLDADELIAELSGGAA